MNVGKARWKLLRNEKYALKMKKSVRTEMEQYIISI